jgi:hypothetical protein
MATYSTDWTGATGTATYGSPTAITNWTAYFENDGSAYKSASFVDAATPVGTRYLKLADTGWGNRSLMHCTAAGIGNLSAATACEALMCWRFNQAQNVGEFNKHGSLAIYSDGSTDGRYYGVGVRFTAGTNPNATTPACRGVYFQGTDNWTYMGAEQTTAVTTPTTLAKNVWWWQRLKVDASGNWWYSIWADGDTEPGWVISNTNNTSRNSGYVGFGLRPSSSMEMHVAYFSVGTGADAAPSPGGGATTRGMPFGNRSTVFNGGRAFLGNLG